ncbi:MAG: cobyric acid synthase, partial [Terriglobia bacterium]
EIHMGRTVRLGSTRPLFRIVERGGKPVDDLDGAVSGDGSVRGTYLHGLFDAAGFRRRILNELRRRRGWEISNQTHETAVEETLKALSALVQQHMDLDALMSML